MLDKGQVSLRGLRENAKLFDELIFDINSDYFEKHGGYEFAKEFYEKAFHFAEQEMGANNIISAVMHADEINTALTEKYGKTIYHYHLHVVALPVVRKEVKWTKKCKDKALIGTTKEVINQVSHSNKWKSEQVLDNQGKPVYDKKGNAVLIKSYSLLQDRFFQYMSDCGYKDFIRGVKGSNQEHLDDLQFKIKKDTERLENITNKVEEKESAYNSYMKYDKQIENISNLGKQKRFSKKIELEQEDYENLTEYAKKGIVADKEIYELNSRIDNLRNAVDKWKSLYDDIVEKAKDYFHAIKLAPQKVADFFKSLFDKEKQDELERYKKEFSNIKSKKSKLIDLMVEDKISENDYNEKVEKYNRKLEILENKIEQLKLLAEDKKSISEGLQKVKELLNSKDIMDQFDQEIFNAIVDYVIVGGYDENGLIDPYLIRFILKREFDLSVPKDVPDEVVIQNNKIDLNSNNVLVDFINTRKYFSYERDEN